MSLSVTRRRTPSLPFHRPCWLELEPRALRANWKALRARLPNSVEMLAVVKANGYGLGILTVAKVAEEAGAVALGVSSVEEGIQLRQAGFKIPILILGSLFPFESFSLLFEHRLTPTVASVEAAHALDRMAADHDQKISVHLKIDSGFGRIGVSIANAPKFIRDVAAMKGIVIDGLYTHFASSDIDEGYTLAQAKAFQTVIKDAAQAGIKPRWIHMANSSALIRFPQTHGNLVRPGIALYGIPPYAGAEKEVKLTPALTWKSRVIYLKKVPAGTSVSYARTWVATRESRIATLAAGYADGLPRLCTNTGEVLIQGHRAKIVGRVTMDMTMVDVTDVPACRVGDEVVLLGSQGKETITAHQMAEWAQTNAYEILCGIGARVPKVITGE